MSRRSGAAVAYILFGLSLCFPWFTFNAKVMGYCHGYAFLRYFGIPVGILAAGILYRGHQVVRILLSELSLAAILGIQVWALGAWQSVANIKGGLDWSTGLRTAVPTYWLSLFLALVLVVMTQLTLFSNPEDVK